MNIYNVIELYSLQVIFILFTSCPKKLTYDKIEKYLI